MKKIRLSLPLLALVIVSTSSIANASAWPTGATGKCNDGTYSYAAHHQGMCSHHRGVAIFADQLPKTTPKPATTTPKQNSIIGLAIAADSSIGIGMSPIIKSANGASISLLSPTAFGNTVKSATGDYLDSWKYNSLICQTGCISPLQYFNGQTGQLIGQWDLTKFNHPDQSSYGIVAGANIGLDTRYLYALISYQPISGVNSVIYRIDTVTNSIVPIFATYCYSSQNLICAENDQITSMRVDHHSNNIYLTIKISTQYQLNIPSRIFSIPQDSPAIVINQATVQHSMTDPFVQGLTNNGKYILDERNPNTQFSSLQPSFDGHHLFYVESTAIGYTNMNKLCRLDLATLLPSCDAVAPIGFLRNVEEQTSGDVIFESLELNSGGSPIFLHNFSSHSDIRVSASPWIRLLGFDVVRPIG